MRAATLTEALSLWRGSPYADFSDERFVRQAVERLNDQRLTALEELAEARLDLGEHHLLAGELTDLVARHPWRERLQAAHLRALYGSGRQHEALFAYEQFRRQARDELGIDPGRSWSSCTGRSCARIPLSSRRHRRRLRPGPICRRLCRLVRTAG
ncbi:AfsR/SARP family transcriptional regulator [Micromonospora sp. BRA006-A]|nr:AfsR/SARP family transcriptional regulator [Micromonospora sp. BRA006-A]